MILLNFFPRYKIYIFLHPIKDDQVLFAHQSPLLFFLYCSLSSIVYAPSFAHCSATKST